MKTTDSYRAVVPFDYWPDDVPQDQRTAQTQKHVGKGKPVPDDVPASSLDWLTADGLIRKVGD